MLVAAHFRDEAVAAAAEAAVDAAAAQVGEGQGWESGREKSGGRALHRSPLAAARSTGESTRAKQLGMHCINCWRDAVVLVALGRDGAPLVSAWCMARSWCTISAGEGYCLPCLLQHYTCTLRLLTVVLYAPCTQATVAWLPPAS